MKDYTNREPEFYETIQITEVDDFDHADNINHAPIQIFQNTLINYKAIGSMQKQLEKVLGGSEDNGPAFVEGIEADNVIDAINQVFALGNEKKQQLVSNLIAMGVQADTSDTWEELLDKMSMVFESIYDAFVAAGVIPTAQTPEALVAAISTLKQQSYNSGKADGAASPADRAISVRGEIVNDGRGTYQGLRINFPNKGTYCQVHNQEYATWYLSQMI